MKVRDKINQAWHITQTVPKLRWFAFLPALITTLVGIVWILYQYTVLAPYFNIDTSGLVNQLLDFVYHNGSWTAGFVVVAIIVFLAYLTLPILIQGGLIAMIERVCNEKKISHFQGVSQGLRVYPPMFEYHTLISPLSVMFIFSATVWMLRGGMISLWPVSVLLLVISFVLGFFFSYVDFFLVLKNRSVFDGIGKSATMVVLHLPETALMVVLMLIIGIRIIMNVLLILFIPLVIVVGTTYLSTLALGVYGIVIAVIVILTLVVLVSYFNALINVFATTVWLLTFKALYNESGDIIDGKIEDKD